MTEPLAAMFGKEAPSDKPRITNLQEARIYADLVQPILQQKCYSCHGSKKQKGKLRLDEPRFITKGGKSKKSLITAGEIEKSELIRRIHLPRSEKKHMPPKEKNQLTEAELALLDWWVEQGASYDALVQELDQSEEIGAYLLALQGGNVKEKEDVLAGVKVAAPGEEAIEALRGEQVIVLPVGEGSHFLEINFVNVAGLTLGQFQLLEPVVENIVRLKLSDQPVSDEFLPVITKMKHLQKLHLDHTRISSEGLRHLSHLGHLTYLNIVGTDVGDEGLYHLKGLPRIEKIFAYQTRITDRDLGGLVELDLGAYVVPTLATDTTRIPE